MADDDYPQPSLDDLAQLLRREPDQRAFSVVHDFALRLRGPAAAICFAVSPLRERVAAQGHEPDEEVEGLLDLIERNALMLNDMASDLSRAIWERDG